MRGGITLAKLARHKASSSADYWHIDSDRTSLDGVGAKNSIYLTSNQAHASGVRACLSCGATKSWQQMERLQSRHGQQDCHIPAQACC